MYAVVCNKFIYWVMKPKYDNELDLMKSKFHKSTVRVLKHTRSTEEKVMVMVICTFIALLRGSKTSVQMRSAITHNGLYLNASCFIS